MPRSVFTDAYASSVGLLVALRKERGVSQIALAERLGKTQQYVSLVENCQRRLDVVEFYAFARALDADVEATFAKLLSVLPAKVRI